MRKAIFIFIAVILVAVSIDCYSYYTKIMANHKLWFVYTMIYPDDYKDVLARLFNEIHHHRADTRDLSNLDR